MVADSCPAGSEAPPLVERGGEAHPVKKHIRETKTATSPRPGRVPGEAALAKGRALICVFDNAACRATFMSCPVFEELRRAADQCCQSGTSGIGRKYLETAISGNPEPRGRTG